MEHAAQLFRDTLQTVAEEHDIQNYDLTIQPISTGGANYSSYLFVAKVSGRKEINVFGKVAAFGEKARSEIPLKLYDSERYFYTILYKKYHDIEEKSQLAAEERLKIPKFYGCNAKLYEETIILEDLVSRGFTTHDRMKSVDWEYASAAVSQLAKFHALSMTYQRDNKEAFDDDVKLFRSDLEKNAEYWKTARKGFANSALEVVSEENKEILKRHIETNLEGNKIQDMFAGNNMNVILHGDYKHSNLMHRIREDGKVEIIPVDFQTLRGGSPLVDLLYFIYTGTDEEFRRLHYQKLVDYYYNELSGAMNRLGIDPGTWTKEDFYDELEKKSLFGLYVSIITLPLMFVETENVPQMDRDTDLSILSLKKAGQLFTERFNGIVNDYIRRGILT